MNGAIGDGRAQIGCERRVDRPIRKIQSRDTVSDDTIHFHEITDDDDLARMDAIGVESRRANAVICARARIEGGVQRAVGVHQGDPIANNSVV